MTTNTSSTGAAKKAVKMERRDLKPVARHQLRLTMVGPFRISTVDLSALAPGRRDFVNLADAVTSAFGLGNGGVLRGEGSYETMVFEGDDPSDLDVSRYHTKADALAGHEAMVAAWLAKDGAR